MNSSKYIFTLDLRSVQSQISLPVTQGDTNRTLCIGFSDGVKPFVPEIGSTAMMSIVRPTGTEVQEFCQFSEDGANVLYPFSKYTVVTEGLHKCQVVLYNPEGKQIAAPKFAINASPKLITGDDIVIPDEDVLELETVYEAEAKRRAYYEDFKKRVEADEFKGDKGDPGVKGDPGDDYVLSEEDRAEIITALLEPIPNGDEVLY